MPWEKGNPQIKGWIQYWETNGFIKSVLWLLSLWIVNIDIKVGFWSVLSLLQHVFSESLPLVCVVIRHKKLNLENDVIQKVWQKGKRMAFSHTCHVFASSWEVITIISHGASPKSCIISIWSFFVSCPPQQFCCISYKSSIWENCESLQVFVVIVSLFLVHNQPMIDLIDCETGICEPYHQWLHSTHSLLRILAQLICKHSLHTISVFLLFFS
jgi:hypothetical protein